MTLASTSDYADRYGAVEDEKRLGVLLDDASALLLSTYERFHGETYEAGRHEDFDRSAASVCCLVVNRVLDVPGEFAGATSLSQGGGGYSASVSFGSSLGEMYLGKSDLKRLGLVGQSMGVLRPRDGDDE